MTSVLDSDRNELAARDLTRAQELLWVTQELHPDEPLYNQGFLFIIHGPLELDRLGRAFRLLLTQSESLRTVIEERAGIPMQRVLDQVDFDIPVVSLAEDDDPRRAFAKWVGERRETSWDLGLRSFDAALGDLGEETGLYFSHHHFVADAASAQIHFRRLGEIYAALEANSSGRMPALPSFQDFVDFERAQRPKRSESEPAAQSPGSRTPLYGHSDPASSTEIDRIEVSMADSRWKRLLETSQQPGLRSITPQLSLFRLFLTAYVAYLYVISGETSVTLGTLSHNRSSRRFRETPGLFTEMFPLVVGVREEETFRSLYDTVVEVSDSFLRGAKPGGSSPLANKKISNVLNYLTTSFAEFAGRRVSARWLHTGHVEPEHLLVLHIAQFDPDSAPKILFDVNKSSFEPSIRSRIPEHFDSVLEAMLADLDQRIDDVEILSESEREALDNLNLGIGSSSTDPTVVARFETRAREEPDRLAVSDGSVQITFGDLLEQVDQASKSLPAGRRVAVDLPRSVEAVVAMLAVMKAGSSFVVIDGSWPRRRIEEVLNDSGAVLLIGPNSGHPGVDSLTYEELISGAADYSSDRPPEPADTAYVLYTSGSTGRPKGVVVSHRALANYVTWAESFYDRGRALSFPLFTPLTFDLTITSMFVPLVSGGTIRVYRGDHHQADLSVQDVFLADEADIVKLTPSHLALLEDLDLSGSTIGQLILGGEELTTAAAQRMSERIPGIEIHNEYGPTEATVGCVIHTYDSESDQSWVVPIGMPISGMRAHVVGRSGRRVPIGVPGELVLAGEGLADGYLNRTEETEARFKANSAVGEARTYLTGDRARIRPDGLIEYLGRLDEQVKVNGVRVELGEVEAAMASHPKVAAAAARMLRTESGSSFGALAGYYTASGDLQAREVRDHVEQILPSTMVPKTFTQLPVIPLTPHGKVDREALPLPEKEDSSSGLDFIAPRTALESQLASVWKDVLSQDQIGVRDSFFELGGDSISAIQVTARARQLGVRVSLRQFFDNPTVEGLAGLPADPEPASPVIRGNRQAPQPSAADLERLAGMLEHREKRGK